MQKQFTATCYILKNQKVLLVYHNKFQNWCPPGGHVEANETPQEAAVRECLEETGLEIKLLSDEHQYYETENAVSLPRPYMCLLEDIPAYKDTPAHQHIDSIFVAKVVGGIERFDENESQGLRWFSLDEIEAIEPGRIFEEVRKSIYTLFEKTEMTQMTLQPIGFS